MRPGSITRYWAERIAASGCGKNDGLGGFSFATPLATSFTSGPGPDWTLDSIMVPLLRHSDASTTRSINVSVFSDPSGLPGSTLVSLTGPLISKDKGPVNCRFTPTSSFLIAPSTTYWVVLSDSPGIGLEQVFWEGTLDRAETGFTGWSIGDKAYEYSGGGWSENLGEGISDPSKFEVAASVVPLPAAAWLFGSALLGVAGLGYRSKRRSAV